VSLSPYQNLLLYYERLQQSYGWTMQEVDGHDIDFLLDQLTVLSLTDDSRHQKYIDDVL
jgi:transketolase N-terminal domain/subunit